MGIKFPFEVDHSATKSVLHYLQLNRVYLSAHPKKHLHSTHNLRITAFKLTKMACNDLQVPSLLELPDLVLELIAKHLSQPDLSNCMQTCSALNLLLRPWQSAMLRARYVGKSWVMRACGRALFRAVIQRWEAGEIRLDSIASSSFQPRPPAHGEDAYLDMQWELAHRVGQSAEAIRHSWARWKAHGGKRPFSPITIDDLVYLCNLAESMGFERTVGQLEKVGKDLIIFNIEREESAYYPNVLYLGMYEQQRMQVLSIFQAKRALLLNSPLIFMDSIHEGDDEGAFLRHILCVELLAGLCLVSFLLELDNSNSNFTPDKAQALKDLVGGPE